MCDENKMNKITNHIKFKYESIKFPIKITYNSQQESQRFMVELSIGAWRHEIENNFALLALGEGNPPVTVGFPSQRPVLKFSLICACANNEVSNQNAGDLRRHCNHYDVTERMRNTTAPWGKFLAQTHSYTPTTLYLYMKLTSPTANLEWFQSFFIAHINHLNIFWKNPLIYKK